eukprot:TRINITY_DN22753_c0_g1_i1.p1 TRINITY_DN22753_c0_g1~~TRINITY_DN22753_c0_g1_i1.p1  ORF type:complete len:245 (+),score=56.85 TRINITY_DN22753_c0_g1_i1:321-1055(+)
MAASTGSSGMLQTSAEVRESSAERGIELKALQRRPPPRLIAENHVYVGRKQALAALQRMVRRILDKRGFAEVYVHGMGATIPKALHLVQDVLLVYGDELEVETSIGTVDVIDDVLDEDAYEPEVQERRVSSLTLCLRRPAGAAAAAAANAASASASATATTTSAAPSAAGGGRGGASAAGGASGAPGVSGAGGNGGGVTDVAAALGLGRSSATASAVAASGGKGGGYGGRGRGKGKGGKGGRAR